MNNTFFYSNTHGDCKVLNNTSSRSVTIQVLSTGTIITTSRSRIKRDSFKDPYRPTVEGKGYLGEGEHKSKINGKMVKEYCLWKSILHRCYSERSLRVNPHYKGCTVAPEWLNYQTFADDIKTFDLYDEWLDDSTIELDKDIKILGNRVYSKATCMFVDKLTNIADAKERKAPFNKYIVGSVHPTNNFGDIQIIKHLNVNKFIVKFINTGFTKHISRSCINTGGIKDNSIQ